MKEKTLVKRLSMYGRRVRNCEEIEEKTSVGLKDLAVAAMRKAGVREVRFNSKKPVCCGYVEDGMLNRLCVSRVYEMDDILHIESDNGYCILFYEVTELYERLSIVGEIMKELGYEVPMEL